MQNKNLIIIATTFVFAVAIVMIVFANAGTVEAAQSSGSCSPTIQILNQDPIPATPSGYVKITFQVSGLNYGCLGNGFAVDINPQYPFSLDSNASAIQTLGSTPPSSQSWTFSYNLRVDPNALDGTYTLPLLYHTGSSTDFTYAVENDFNISVSNVQTDFAVVVQSVSGTQASIGVVNIGENPANSLIVGIPQQQNFRAVGTSQQILGNLAAGDYTIATFSITPTGSAMVRNSSGARVTPGSSGNFNTSSQNLEVQLDYTDAIGIRRTVVKEVPYSASFSNATTGNFTGRTFNRSSGISFWWYILIAAVVLVAGFIFFRNRHRIKQHFSKRRERHSNKVPDWVAEERTHKK